MATSPDLPTPITPDPTELPVEPDRGPTTPLPSDPSSPFVMKPERPERAERPQSCAVMRTRVHPNFMRAAAFHWPAAIRH